ncbi:MAG: 3-keto-5-aminohexanoate cleavage protein [Nitrososphaerales archaeon]
MSKSEARQRAEALQKYKSTPVMPTIRPPPPTRGMDFTVQKRWNIDEKVVIGLAPMGTFINKDQNPNQPISVAELLREYEACIKLGAVSLHVHVRDDNGKPTSNLKYYRALIEPLRKKFGDSIVIDGGTQTGKTFEEQVAPVTDGLFDMALVNASTGLLGESIRCTPKEVMQAKARFYMDCGAKPMIDIHDAGSINNARRYLIEPGILEKPFVWHLLPGLPGCFDIPDQMGLVKGVAFLLDLIMDLDDESIIMMSDTSRSTIYMPILAMMMGHHVRVGMEDTIWRYPHKDDLIESNDEVLSSIVDVARTLGRRPATAQEYRKMVGLA